jgi:hypothetical protein
LRLAAVAERWSGWYTFAGMMFHPGSDGFAEQGY